jgi:hypothetical protein
MRRSSRDVVRVTTASVAVPMIVAAAIAPAVWVRRSPPAHGVTAVRR